MSDDKSTPEKAKSPFADLLKEIGDCPQAEAKQHLAEWQQRLDTMWPADVSNDKYWELLIQQLPVPEIATKKPRCKALRNIALRTGRKLSLPSTLSSAIAPTHDSPSIIGKIMALGTHIVSSLAASIWPS